MKNLYLLALTLFLFNSNFYAQNGLSFDGTNDQVDCGNNTSVQITGTAITLEAWIYPTSWQTNIWQGNIINKESLAGGGYMLRCGAGGKLNFNIGSGPGWNEISSATNILTLNTWQHVAGTYDGSYMRIYLNGVLVDSLVKNISMASSTSNLGIGYAPIYAGSRNFPGKIDEVRIWSITRSESEIAANMNTELCSIPSSVKAYYTFNQGVASGTNTTITTLTDLSGYGNTGTLTNLALTGTSSNWVTGKTFTPCYPVCYGPTQTLVECDGYSITVGSNTYTTTGVYTDTLVGVGCDSIVVTDLTVNLNPLFTQTLVECTGYSITVGTNTYSTTGVYVDTLVASSSLGCDSIVTTNLTVGSYKTSNQTFSECIGFTVSFGTNTYSTTGMYHDTLIGMATGGCDSIVNTDLTILSHSSATDVIVACDTYTWMDGNTYTASNMIAKDTILNAAGCDSIVTLNLTINFSTASVDVHAACDSYTWINGSVYTASNSIATHTLVNAAGCDSVVTLNLTITNSTTSTDVHSACTSYTWIDGVTYTSSNTTAKDTLVNAVGCDSVVTLNLTINSTYVTTDVQTVCDSLIWADGNTYYSNNNTATYMTQSVSGCDSIASLDLTIINSTVFTDVIQACADYTWINGVIYTSSNNTATDTLVSVNGCDSIVLLDLTINNATSGADIQTACDSLVWIDGITYYSNNSNATFTIVNAGGCDSVVRLFLTIQPIDVTTSSNWSSISANAVGMTYQWMDCSANSLIAGATNITYTATVNGSYAVIISNSTGCVDTSNCVNLTNVGINEAELIGISVYPNPTNDVLNIDKGTNASLEITITNSTGAVVYQSNTQNQTTTINMSNMATGMYVVTLKNELGKKIEKVVKR
ncbi:MAG: hypothetical protein ACI85Q_002440 [Salibacteraceae bacterium]|jgi:hypothetical protein